MTFIELWDVTSFCLAQCFLSISSQQTCIKFFIEIFLTMFEFEEYYPLRYNDK
jgi:hypothetical protein